MHLFLLDFLLQNNLEVNFMNFTVKILFQLCGELCWQLAATTFFFTKGANISNFLSIIDKDIDFVFFQQVFQLDVVFFLDLLD